MAVLQKGNSVYPFGGENVNLITGLDTLGLQVTSEASTEGQMESWSKDSLKWLDETFGKGNTVYAVLHMDETTAHIHANVVLIVKGEQQNR